MTRIPFIAVFQCGYGVSFAVLHVSYKIYQLVFFLSIHIITLSKFLFDDITVALSLNDS